eukprot:CAMPEP_0206458998 /NCGR_PEP_ID=MMETSP0324_2-20121206/23915_1 /ASSEMBLY_ACC=CAM_ASM_000836 /TAXON_ID=2866 /ORGANISM="Crypthecodinium cohnii, Strain Seligo" /LENGTH=314 /DNA_ID=CAMNT_0053930467 /DNA_START=33 /DNA_END=973 /DNA_ORIENTATION=-
MAVLEQEDEQLSLTKNDLADESEESDSCGADERATPLTDAKRAYRMALGALLLSGLLFVVALGTVVRAALLTAGRGALAGTSPAPANVEESVALSSAGKVQALRDSVTALAGSFGHPGNDDEDGEILLPTRYVLQTSAHLRPTAGATEGGRVLPKGAKVFVIKHHEGWLQVVVATSPGVVPGFGWLPVEEDGRDVLEEDVLSAPVPQKQKAPISAEELDKRWEEVRSQNSVLKNSLTHLQDSLKHQFAERLKKTAGHKVHTAAAQGQESESATAAPMAAQDLSKAAVDAVDVEEVKKDVSAIKSSVEKELQAPP